MISLKSFLLYLHIPGERDVRYAQHRLSKWEQKRAAEPGNDSVDANTVKRQSLSDGDTQSSEQEKDWGRIIEEVLRSNTHL